MSKDLDPTKAERKLFANYFKKKKIYIEVNCDDSKCNTTHIEFVKCNAILCNRLMKSIHYIIFNEGRQKVLKYAYEKHIKVVTPEWLSDKMGFVFKKDKHYLYDYSYTLLILDEILKEKEAMKLGSRRQSRSKRSQSQVTKPRLISHYYKSHKVNKNAKDKRKKVDMDKDSNKNDGLKQRNKSKSIMPPQKNSYLKVSSINISDVQSYYLWSISDVDYVYQHHLFPIETFKAIFINPIYYVYDTQIMMAMVHGIPLINIEAFMFNYKRYPMMMTMDYLKEFAVKYPSVNEEVIDWNQSTLTFYIERKTLSKNATELLSIILQKIFGHRVINSKEDANYVISLMVNVNNSDSEIDALTIYEALYERKLILPHGNDA